MTNEDRMGIKNSILHYLCDEWEDNRALFNKENGYPLWCDIDLMMVMEKVVSGIYAYKGKEAQDDE